VDQTQLFAVSCIRLIGCLPSSEQCQLKDFKETVNVGIANLPDPIALHLDSGQDILFLVWSFLVKHGSFSFLEAQLLAFRHKMKLPIG